MPKDNPFSDNPFGGRNNDDPFQANAAAQPQSNGWGGGGAWGANNGSASSGPSSSSAGAFNVPPAQEFSVPKREDLDAKERALAAKEAELARWEEQLKASGQLKPAKNWPSRCFPILHHDIAGDVPADHQRMVYFGYCAWLGYLLCATFNAFASLMALCVLGSGSSRLPGFLMSVVYFFAGVPGSWILWYRRLYNFSRNDRAFTALWFFLFFLVHIGWCAWSAVSPPIPFGFSKWAMAGYVPGIESFSHSIFVGVVYVVGAAFWTIEGLFSLWTLFMVYHQFRNSGGTTRLKQEAATTAVKAGMSRGGKKAGGKVAMSAMGEV